MQPSVPAHYLNLRTQHAFEAVARRDPDPALMPRYNAIAATTTPRQAWRSSAVVLFRNWLRHITAHKAATARAGRKAENRVTQGAKA